MKKAFYILLFWSILSSHLWADIVVDLRTGSEWEGEIVEQESNEKWVVLRVAGGGTLRFPRNQIEIKKTTLKDLTFPLPEKNPAENPENKNKTTHTQSTKKNNPNSSETVGSASSSTPTKNTEVEKGNLSFSTSSPTNTTSQPSPENILIQESSFLDYLLARPWYHKLFLGATIILSLFTLIWKLFLGVPGSQKSSSWPSR